MNALVIVCHPDERSLTHAAAHAALDGLEDAGGTVVVHDLYREGFDPVLTAAELHRRFSFDETVQRHMDDLGSCDGLVVVHPDWWGQTPALLKGWLDRVLRPGIAYEYSGEEFARKVSRPLLTGKKAKVFITTDARKGTGRHPLEAVWSERVFSYVGIEDATVDIMYGVFESTRKSRRTWLEGIREAVRLWH